MGNDGGVIAVQRKFLRGVAKGLDSDKKVAEEMTRKEKQEIKLRQCAISNEPLKEPIVACELGNLYNKDVILVCLLERKLNIAYSHIRGMKDLIDCKFTKNPEYKENGDDNNNNGTSSSSSGGGDSNSKFTEVIVDFEQLKAQFVCPVTMVEMNSKSAFVVLKSTGWVLSDKAIKEIGIDNLQQEYGPFSQDDIIRLIPEDKEIESIKAKLETKRAAEKAAKKDKKKRKRDTEDHKNDGEKKIVKEEEPSVDKKGKSRAKLTYVSSSNVQEVSTVTNSTMYNKIAQEAMKNVDEQKNSATFKSLFNDGGKAQREEEAKNGTRGNKLFIATAPSRYTT